MCLYHLSVAHVYIYFHIPCQDEIVVMRIPIDTMKISIMRLFNLVNTKKKNKIKITETKNFEILLRSRRYSTFVTGLVPVLASHSIRQESSPTLQNSCALVHKVKIYQKHHQNSESTKKYEIKRRRLY